MSFNNNKCVLLQSFTNLYKEKNASLPKSKMKVLLLTITMTQVTLANVLGLRKVFELMRRMILYAWV